MSPLAFQNERQPDFLKVPDGAVTMSTLTRLISSLMAAFSCWMVDGLVS